MGDKLLDTTQLVNGIAVLLSFFVGYKYAVKKHGIKEGGIGGKKSAPNKEAMAASQEFEGAVGKVEDKSPLFVNFSNTYKMVLVVRNDLKMGKGKIAAQCGHGAVGAYQQAVERTPRLVRAWENSGCAKIAVRVDSERELMLIKRSADSNNLNTCLIRDAGRTQIEPNSKTVLAIGPAAVEAIDQITGHLKLL